MAKSWVVKMNDEHQVLETLQALHQIQNEISSIVLRLAALPPETSCRKECRGALHSLGQSQQSINNLVLALSRLK